MFSLADGTILHLEFQSGNDKNMPYREGIYCLLLGQKYRRRVRQVVLYVGQPIPFKRLILRTVLRNVNPMVIRLVAVPDFLDLTDFDQGTPVPAECLLYLSPLWRE